MDFKELNKKSEKFQEHENDLKGAKKFFGEKEAALFSSLGREVTEGWVNESMILYRIDLKTTKNHALYGEAIIKNWLPEIEIFGRINVESEKPSFQTKGGIIKKGMGRLTADVYIEHLEELGLVQRQSDNEIIFGIRMGDFVGFKGQYYEVRDDGYSQISNEHSWAGDRRFFITIDAIEVDEDIFKAR